MSANKGTGGFDLNSLIKLIGVLIAMGFSITLILILLKLFVFTDPSPAAVANASPTAGASSSLTVDPFASPTLEITLAPGETSTPTAQPTATLAPGETAQPTPKPTKTPKPTRTPKPTKEATPTPETATPTPSPTPVVLNDGQMTTWTSKQTRDQPTPIPSPPLDPGYSTLEVRFQQSGDSFAGSNSDNNAEVDVSTTGERKPNGNIKLTVTLTNGGFARGEFVFTITEVSDENGKQVLKGTYKYTPPGSNPTEETGTFKMTHT